MQKFTLGPLSESWSVPGGLILQYSHRHRADVVYLQVTLCDPHLSA